MDARAILCTTNGESMKHCPQCSTGYPDSLAACPTHGLPLNEIRDLKPGMVIHHSYRIVRKLGQGGMGAVYLAQHTLMDEPRALKFLSAELSQDQAFTARFLREVRTLRQIRHPNVVDCGDLESAEDGSLFFSMEFVDGPDLRAFLRDYHSEQAAELWVPQVPILGPGIPRSSTSRFVTGHDFSRAETPQNTDGVLTPAGALPVELALHLTRQIAHGLAAAHARGMVHRDIKPENILLARDGSGWQPKIADFGIVATKESSSVFTRTGGTLLTVAYAAPEQWRGTPAAELDGRTDLYALGGLLYEMLTGQTAFHAESYEGWAHQHQTTPPPPPSALRPDLANWQGLDALVLRLLAKDREDRPKDVAELLGLLDAVRYVAPEVHRETVVETPMSRATKMFRGLGRRRKPRWVWITFASVAALVIVISGLALSLPTSMIAKRADYLDKKQHYYLGGIVRNLACSRGDGDSCGELAYMYDTGRGVARDYPRATVLYLREVALLSKACDAGDALDCHTLSNMYEEGGPVVAKDITRAASLYSREAELLSKACDEGNASDCFEAGGMYDLGYLIEKDYPRAAALYKKACDANSAEGCEKLGFMYDVGEGVAENDSTANELYSKSCDLGDKFGCRELANRYQFGVGAPRNVPRARELWSKACSMGTEYACAEAAKLQ
jgi:serine/threonine protein kinase/TPR repeat protein